MKLPRFWFCAFALVSLLLAGCSGGFRPGGVTVAIVDFKPTEASLLESSGILTLRYTNENVAPLGFSGSKHKLYLNGSYVGTAVSDQPFGVPPLNSVTQNVTVRFENLALIKQLIALGDSATASYRIESVLYQTVDEDKYDLKVLGQGSIDLRGAATAAK